MNTNINQSSDKLRYIDMPVTAPEETPVMAAAAEVPPAAPGFELFGHIALSFSGGGFRAAAYALGVLSLLNEIKDEKGISLLKHVRYISSASGGSITTAAYALSESRNEDFATFYQELHDNLANDKVLQEALRILAKDSVWQEPQYIHKKRQNLINAFAIAYDRLLYKGNTIGDMNNGSYGRALEEVCLNATEFYKGMPFRQNIYLRKEPDGYHDVLYGNFAVKMPPHTSNPLRLADLVAASACFPAGFEPIIFPTEFVANLKDADLFSELNVQPQEYTVEQLKFLYNEEDIEDFPGVEDFNRFKDFVEKQQSLPNKSQVQIGLMDGGITDNQAIDSVISAQIKRMDNANTTAEKEETYRPFDLIMLNDVASHFMSPYKLGDPDKPYKGWQFLTIKAIFIICLVFSVISIAGCICSFTVPAIVQRAPLAKVILMISSLFFIVPVAVSALLIFLKRKIAGNVNDNKEGFNLRKNFSDDIQKNFFRYFARVPLWILIRMLSERANSMLALNNEVFLKRTRYLLLREIFQVRNWSGRLLSNNIYELAFTNNSNHIQNNAMSKPFASYTPGIRMQRVAQAAFDMPTVLWFDKPAQQKKIQAAVIATGQFTTCYNLLVYLDEIDGLPECKSIETQAQITHIRTQLMALYNRFRQESFCLYNDITKTEAVSDKYFETPESFRSYRASTSAHAPTP